MRGVSAWGVMLTHLGYLSPGLFVDTFFVLSSFLGTVILYEKYQSLIKDRRTLRDWGLMLSCYAVKRIGRIFPLIAALGLFFTLLTPQQLTLMYDFPVNFEFSYWSFLVLKAPFGVLWTIPVELEYYCWVLLLTLVYCILPHRYFKILLITGIVIKAFENGFFDSAHARGSTQPFHRHQWTFLMGSVTGFVFVDIQKSERIMGLLARNSRILSITCAFLIFYIVTFTLSPWLFPYLFWTDIPKGYHYPFTSWAVELIIVKEALQPGAIANYFSGKLLRYYGKIGYSIYLIHPVVLIIKHLNLLGDFPLSPLYYVPLLTIIISTITFYFIEKPGVELAAKICKAIQKYEDGPEKQMFIYKWIDSIKQSRHVEKLSSYFGQDNSCKVGDREINRDSTCTLGSPKSAETTINASLKGSKDENNK